MSRVPTDLVQGLLTGIAREAARVLDVPVSSAQCRHAAWLIGNAGFGLSYAEIGAASSVTKQAVQDAISAMADRCEVRAYERRIIQVADAFGVTL